MYIDISSNTLAKDEHVVLWIAQRTHHFSCWWLTYTTVQFLLGIIAVYLGYATSKTVYTLDDNRKKAEEKWKTAGCWVKFFAYLFFLYEIYHHYMDIFYIFFLPHWSAWVVFFLLLSFWVPLTVTLLLILETLKSGKNVFYTVFVYEGYVTARKFYRLAGTNVIHLSI